MQSPQEKSSQDESASFAHSLSAAPLDAASAMQSLNFALNGGTNPGTVPASSTGAAGSTAGTEAISPSSAIPVSSIPDQQQQQQPQQSQQTPVLQPETRMAVAELLVSLGQSSRAVNESTHSEDTIMTTATPAAPKPKQRQQQTNVVPFPGTEAQEQSPMYRNAVDYVGSVKKAYHSNPRVYAEFLEALEKYHNSSMALEQLVPTVMSLFQDQPDLLMGFKDFLPEAQNLMNRLVPPMMYSDYKSAQAQEQAQASLPTTSTATTQNGVGQILDNNGHAAADFLTMIKNLSQQEPDMYQHMIALLRKFQKDHSYSTLYFYISIVLRYHPHLLQRFHKFLPTVPTGVEVTEPRIISKAPPEELVVSTDFIEAKDFVQTVKQQAKSDMSMYDRFIFALEKYQRTGWTIDQVYSEVSLIFWNHPDALAGFKQFISTVPQS
ncbi:Paired amphipathic helix protein Sin3b [Podila humilis]|nr:Paired amphipathic helix protein Sin3b [Podila humilis]